MSGHRQPMQGVYRPMPRAVGLLIVALLVAGACGTPGASPSPSTSPEAAWDQVLDEITPEGEITRETALRMFALVHGPMPGVELPSGRIEEIPSGTLATRSLLSYWESITEEQRSAATSYLRSGIETPLTANADMLAIGVSNCVAHRSDADPAALARWEATVDEAAAYISSHLLPNRDLTATLSVAFNKTKQGDYGAQAVPRTSECGFVGDVEECIIQVNPNGQTQEGPDLRWIVAHEVFHCFQMVLRTVQSPRVAWLEEGSATWVGYEFVDGATNYLPTFWQQWLTEPGKPLFQRAYDAVGFFAHMKDTGVDPWSVLDQMVTVSDSSNAAYLMAVQAAPDRMLDEWGPGYVRDAARAPMWEHTGLAVTADKYALPTSGVGNGATETMAAAPLSAAAGQFVLSADVVVITSTAHHGRILFAGGVDLPLSVVDGQPMCTLEGGCACPAGIPDPGFGQAAAGIAHLGVAGHLSGVSVLIRGFSLEAFCGATESAGAPSSSVQPPTPRPTIVGPATAFVSGVGTLTGGWCTTTHRPADGAYAWQLFFGDGRPNFYSMALESTTPIEARTYSVAWNMVSTIKQDDFYVNIRVRQLTLAGEPGPKGLQVSTGSFVGEYHDQEQAGWIIAGSFDCRGALAKRDFVLGWPVGQTLIPGIAETDVVINAQSEPDGSNPVGTISIEVGDPPVAGELLPWATVVCLDVEGASGASPGLDNAGLVAVTTVPFGGIAVGTYVFFGGQPVIESAPQGQYGHIVEGANDPFAFGIVGSGDTCAPHTLPRDGLGHFSVHDEP